MNRIVILIAILISVSSFAEESVKIGWDVSPVNPDNKEAAEFGLIVAAKSLSIASNVEDGTNDGDRIVSVLVAGKNCKVTVSNESGKWVAYDINCQQR